ncbi:MAG: FeoB-associated Cys-rich membrane protein [Clostridia bacterium]|nr:FeoB-associated Cys-rich membrane protein [Clostridia bacterium]
MNLTLPDIIAITAIVLVVGLAVFYIVWAKKKGKRCIGCPDGDSCSGNCQGCTGCHHIESTDGDSADDERDGGCPFCKSKQEEK